jgi:hypothetical protein
MKRIWLQRSNFVPLTAAILLGAPAGCERLPTAVTRDTGVSSVSVTDATTLGVPGFYFVPPTVPAMPAFSGTFDASVLDRLTVDVCEVDAADECPDPPIANYNGTATGRDAIRLNRAREMYFVYWNIAPAAAGAGRVYRATVRADGIQLGRIDLADPVAGRWLPLAFRIEQGALEDIDPPEEEPPAEDPPEEEPPAEDPPEEDPPADPAPITTNAHDARLGSGLQSGAWTFTLDSPAPAGGLEVQIRSVEPQLLRVAPNHTTPGSDAITVSVGAGVRTGTFWLQGVEGATGAAMIELAAEGFAGSATVNVVPVAADIAGLGSSLSAVGPDVPFRVRIGAVDEAGTGLTQQAIRAGGVPLTFTVSNSDAAVGELVTSAGAGQVRSVTVGVGEFLSPADVASGGIAFDALGVGTTTVTLSHPVVTLLAGATKALTVTAGLNVNTGNVRVGSGLQHLVTVTLDAPAPAGGVTIRLESSDPGLLLLSPGAATAGTGVIDVFVGGGAGGTGFYISGMEGRTGTATITASATGYDAAANTVEVAPPAVIILFLEATQSATGANDPFVAAVGALNVSGTHIYTEQVVRAGGTPITVDIANSDATVAQLVTAGGAAQAVSVTIAVGQRRSPATLGGGGVEFDPLAPGQTSVVASGTGLVQVPASTRTVTVN